MAPKTKSKNYLRLGVNIDHVATVRNARGGVHPDPVRAAKLATRAGADNITAHFREDKRHIRQTDIERIKKENSLPLNFEMAATDQMLALALKVKPHASCIVPEKREELTTEGGLNVIKQRSYLKDYIAKLKKGGIRVSLFVEPSEKQLLAAREIGADVVELHTGRYAELLGSAQKEELKKLQNAARYADEIGLECHAGHGLNFKNVGKVAQISEIKELNIGHFIIGEAIFVGLENAIRAMRILMDEARKKR